MKDVTAFETSRRYVELKAGNGTTDNAATFAKNDAALAIAHANATITSTSGTHLKNMTVELTNAKTDDAMTSTATLTGTNIAVAIDTSVSGKVYVRFTGEGTLANYLAALKGVKFNNTAAVPDGTSRVITVVANNGPDTNTATATITVVMAPELAIGDGITDNTGTFTEGDPALAIAHANSTLVGGIPSTIASMTVELTNAKTDDAMTSTATLTETNITAAVDTATPGKIFVNFTGEDTAANYLIALKGVKFNNTSSTPDETSRVITVECSNGLDSNTATATITVVATA